MIAILTGRLVCEDYCSGTPDTTDACVGRFRPKLVVTMLKQPSSNKEIGTWLNRHTIMARVLRLHQCRLGHQKCSTHPAGPCSAEIIDALSGHARDRALELASCGAPRGEVWAIINREFPALGPDRLQPVIDEAYSLASFD